MGRGITVDLLYHGISVVLVDIDDIAIEKGKREIINQFRFMPLIKKYAEKIDIVKHMSNVTFTTNVELAGDCDFIIENVSEKGELKVRYTGH